MAQNPFDDIPAGDASATAVAPNPFDSIPGDEPARNPFDDIPVTKPVLSQAEREKALRAAAGVEEIDPFTKFAAGASSGISKGLYTPDKLLLGGADLLLGAFGAGDTELGRGVADRLKAYNERERRMSELDRQMFGEGDIAGNLGEGVGRAAVELPLNLVPAAGASTPAQAVRRAAGAAGIIGGGSQYAEDRGEGKDRATSALYGTASGAITAATTGRFGATGIESIFRKAGVPGVMNAVRQGIKDAGMEFTEEAVDQIQQDLLARIARNPDKPIADSLKDVLMAGGVGAILGGGVSTAKGVGDSTVDALDARAENKAFEQASKAAADRAALEKTFPDLATGKTIPVDLNAFNRDQVGVGPAETSAGPGEVESVALDPATGLPPESSAQKTLAKAAARLTEIQSAPKNVPAAVVPTSAAQGQSPVTTPEAAKVTEDNVETLPVEQQKKLGHRSGMEYGVDLGEADLPRLQEKYDNANKELQKVLEGFKPDISPEEMQRINNAQAALFGKMNFYAGALMGASRGKHPVSGTNWEGFVQERKAAGKPIPETPKTPTKETIEGLAEELGLKQPRVLKFFNTHKWSFHDPVTDSTITIEVGATKEALMKKRDEARARYSDTSEKPQGAGQPPAAVNIPPVVGEQPAAPAKAGQPKTMAEIPDKANLVWYQTNPKYLVTLLKRLQASPVYDQSVIDSITPDGRVAFVDVIDPKTADLLRLKPEKLKDPQAEAERVFQLAKSAPANSPLVDATLLGKAEVRALLNRGMSFKLDKQGRRWGQYTAEARKADAEAAAKEAAKANRPKPGEAARQKAEDRPSDIIDKILEDHGSILNKSAIKGGGGDNYKDGYFIARRSNPKSRFSGKTLFSDTGTGADVMAGNLGMTVDQMWNEIDRAHAARAEWARGENKTQQDSKFWNAVNRQEARTKSTEAVSMADPEQVKIGTKFTIEGVEFEVTYIDLEAGEVTVKDGRKFGIQHIPESATIKADKGSLEVPKEEGFNPEGESPPPPEPPADEGPAPKSMGAALFGEFEAGPGDYVSNMFAAIDRDRVAMGKAPMEKAEPRTWDEDNQRALAKMNREPDWIPQLLLEVRANPRPLLSWENAGVVWYRAKLKAEANNALGRINRAFEDGDKDAMLAAKVDAAKFESALMELDEAVGRGGTGSEAGRTLQAQKMGAGDDFTLVEMRMQRRAIENDGAPLTPNQEAEVQALYDEIKATKEAFEKYVKDTEAKEAGRLAKEALDQIERERNAPKASSYVIKVAEKWVAEWDQSAKAAEMRLMKRLGRTNVGIDPTILSDLAIVGRSYLGHIGLDVAKFGEKMVAKFGDFVKPHIQQIFDASRALVEKSNIPETVKKTVLKVKDMTGEQRKSDLTEKLKDKFDQGKKSEITNLVQKLARQFVEDGVRGWEPLLDAVHGVLREIDPEITRRETMDAISGYGQYKRLAKDEVSVALREAKGEMQQVAKIEDITAGEKPKPTGIERRVASEAERAKIKLVNELKKKHPELFEGSGLKSALESRKTYYRNRLSDLREEIANRELAIKNKTASPTDAELEAIKAEYEIVKAEHDAYFKQGITDAERLRLALAGVERQMAELQRKIDAKDFSKRKPSPIAKAPELVKLKSQRDLLRDEFNDLRNLDEAYQREQVAKKLERDKATLERTIAEQERKLAAGDIAPKGKLVNRPAHPELEPLRRKLDDINRQLAEARKPKRSEADILLTQFKARRARQIADWERRIAEGDFEKKPRREVRMDREALELQGKAEKAKNDFLRARWEWRQAQRTTGRKIWDGIQKSRGAFVNIASSFDFSAPRQALLAILSNTTRLVTNPASGARLLGRPFVDMFKAWASDTKARGIEQRIKNRPSALNGADKAAKIEYSSLDSNTFTKYEENAHSVLDEWAELPLRTGKAVKTAATLLPKLGARGVRMSNRAFITFLNQTRAGLFDELLRVNFKDRPPTQTELEVIGNMVNIATGRGKMKPVTAQVASELLWAPKLLASRVQFLTGQPLWTGKWAESARARRIVAKEYARIIMGGFLLATVSRMFSDKEEDDPTSSDFGKVVRGNTRIDPWGGLQQVTTLGARLGTASTKTLKGDKRDIGAAKKYGQRNPWYVTLDFFRSKLRPDIATAVDIVNRTDFAGNKTTPQSVAKNLLVPLPMREVVSIMKENGWTEGMIIEALGQFGAGVSVYENKESQK